MVGRIEGTCRVGSRSLQRVFTGRSRAWRGNILVKIPHILQDDSTHLASVYLLYTSHHIELFHLLVFLNIAHGKSCTRLDLQCRKMHDLGAMNLAPSPTRRLWGHSIENIATHSSGAMKLGPIEYKER